MSFSTFLQLLKYKENISQISREFITHLLEVTWMSPRLQSKPCLQLYQNRSSKQVIQVAAHQVVNLHSGGAQQVALGVVHQLLLLVDLRERQYHKL